MSKESVSSCYMAEQKYIHSGKKLPLNRIGLITGDGRTGSIGEAIRKRLNPEFMLIESFQGDIRDMFNIQLQMKPELDTLILCHGVTHMDWFEEAPPEKLLEVVNVNLTGTIMAIQEFVKATIDSAHKKQIIVIGSMASKAVLNGSAVYCASKCALNHLIKCLAWELAPKGFDLFIINPSNTEGTPMTEDTITGLMRYRGLSRQDAEAYWGACLPRKDWLQTSDIAGLIDFILFGPSQYLSGATLDLAGGQR